MSRPVPSPQPVDEMNAAEPSRQQPMAAPSSSRRLQFIVAALMSIFLVVGVGWWGSRRMMLSWAHAAAADDRLAEAEHWLDLAGQWAVNPAAAVFGKAHVARLSGDIDRCRELLILAENFGFPVEKIRREQELLSLQSGAHRGLAGDAAALRSLALQDPETCEAVSNGLLVRGNAQAAIAVLEKRIAANPDSARLLSQQAKILGDIGREAEAFPLYQKALVLNQDFLGARIGLADTLFVLEKMPDSLAHYEFAIEQLRPFVKPGDVSATDADRLINCNLAKAHVLIQLKREDDAIETLNPLTAAFPENFAARYLLATAYSDKGQSEQVIATILPIIEKFPLDVSLNYLLANAESQLGNLERSEQRMQKYLDGRTQLDELKKLEFDTRGRPPSADVCLQIALGYLSYRWDDAEPWLERAYQLQRDSPGVLLAWANYYLKLGKTRQAARYLEAGRRASQNGY